MRSSVRDSQIKCFTYQTCGETLALKYKLDVLEIFSSLAQL